MPKILVIEDDKRLQNIIADYLLREGYEYILADDGIDALAIIKTQTIDIIISDILMPNLDGFTVCKIVREISDIPIIIITAKHDESDKLKGYDLGADDYITKPFSPNILIAKIRVLLKRIGLTQNTKALHAGKISVIPASQEVYVNCKKVKLTHKEYELLIFLIRNQKQVFTREHLLNKIWGFDCEITTRTVDAHIKNLRQKLGKEGIYIITLIRSGYKFEVINNE